MDISEAQQFIKNRLSSVNEGEWRHPKNEETYRELLRIMEPYMPLDLATSVLSSAFWTAVDECAAGC